MVHIHTQGVLVTSSSRPNAANRRNFRGSIPSRPVAGQPEEHAPQVRHKFRFPPSGNNPFTLSMKVLFLSFPMVTGSIGLYLLSFNYDRSEILYLKNHKWSSFYATASAMVCFFSRKRFGPKLRMVSVKRVTTSANRGASADDTHSMANRRGSIPTSSNIIRIASARANAM